MNDSPQSRQELLDRVRAANGGAAALDEAAAAWQKIPRAYNCGSYRSREAVLHLLGERLRDYDAEVARTPAASALGAVERVLAERNYPRMLVAAGMAPEFLRLRHCTGDQDFLPAELDAFDGVITEATLAIAETGTLVLQNVPGQGRRAATLVPDFHLCLLRIEDVVETVPEAIRLLKGTAPLPTTFISGPSATADIEMTRIKGVHGPRFSSVLLVE